MKFEGKLPKILIISNPSGTDSLYEKLQKGPSHRSKLDYMVWDELVDNGHWEFPDKMGPPYIGFIYAMYDPVLGRAYIGKKVYLGTGQKNRGKDSGWRNYVSSSNLLKELFQHRPVSEFEFICIEQYKTKGTLSYAETWSLCMAEAPTSKLFYNTRIESVSWSVKEPISERHKERLSMIIKRVKENNE